MLQHLGQLQTLWMNENLVTQIEGLKPLTKLTTLWLARNQIRRDIPPMATAPMATAPMATAPMPPLGLSPLWLRPRWRPLAHRRIHIYTHMYAYLCTCHGCTCYIAVLTLAVLTLAGPHCSSISDALDDNRALTDLNLSATAVGSFKDIPHLARLRHLRTLAFSDLHYGESPV